MKIDRRSITVCYPSQATHLLSSDARMFHENFCAVADGTPLPEELSDLFKATVLHENGRVIVRIEFA